MCATLTSFFVVTQQHNTRRRNRLRRRTMYWFYVFGAFFFFGWPKSVVNFTAEPSGGRRLRGTVWVLSAEPLSKRDGFRYTTPSTNRAWLAGRPCRGGSLMCETISVFSKFKTIKIWIQFYTQTKTYWQLSQIAWFLKMPIRQANCLFFRLGIFK